MQHVFTDAALYQNGRLHRGDISFLQDQVMAVPSNLKGECLRVSSLQGKLMIPGLVDVHVHLREPGFSYKETMQTGTQAAARGGYTAVCAMPNLNPPPDSVAHVKMQKRMIDEAAVVHVYPYGAITKGQAGRGELVDYQGLSPHVVAFSDDGRGVQEEDTMRRAMEQVRRVDGLLVAHCEDEALLRGGYIHDGDYAKAHGHKGIASESEWRQVERDLRLARETGCRYHVCHVSTKESVALIRQAKAQGVDVTCETAPHYLLLDDRLLQEEGRFKMNPPIRGQADRQALLEGLADGTVDIIATDHAPHSTQEKAGGLKGSLMGVVGLECAFAVLYTGLVRSGLLSLERLLQAMTDAPRKRFRLPECSLMPGQRADYAVFDLDVSWTVQPERFVSLGKATPFAGAEVWGQCVMTVVGGEEVWKQK